MSGRHPDTLQIDARLRAAAETGEMLELILVVHGKVRPAHRPGRWRVAADGAHALTFSAETVVAATPISPSNDRRGQPPSR
jgi:hypothetical protein